MAKVNRQAVFEGEKSPMQILAEDTAVAEKNVLVYTETVRKLNSELTNTQTLAKAMQGAMGTSTGSNLGDLEKSNALHKEAIALYGKHQVAKSTLEKTSKQLEIETNALRISEEKLWQEMLKSEKAEKALEAQTARLTAQQERLRQKTEQSSGSYMRVQKWLTKLNQEHRNLAIRQELGGKLTQAEITRMDTLAGRISKYDSALKAVDATQGKHFRNVGNYKSGFDGLSGSVNQLTRELPAFANSFQTGFMAISNNLPIFFDEIKRIRVANEQLRAEGQKVTSVFRQLASSVFSVGTALSVGVTLLTVYGPKLFEYIQSLFTNVEAEKKLKEETERRANAQKYANEQTKKATEFVGRESSEYVGYILQLKQTNAGSKERADLIDEINDKYGRTLKNIRDETKFQAQLNNEIKSYISFQRARYEVEKNQDLIARNLSRQDAIRRDLFKMGFSKETTDAITKSKGAMEDFAFTTNEFFNISEKNKSKAINYANEILRLNERLESYGFNLLEANGRMDDLGFETEETTKETKKLTYALKEFDDELSRRLDLGERERKLRQDMTEIGQDNQIATVAEIAQRQIDEMMISAEETGQIFVDTIEMLLNEEFDMRKAAAVQRAQFEKDELLKRVDATRVLEYERLTKERDDLLKQEGLTAEGRAAIRASYEKRLQELNGRMLEEERIVALEREKIELELQQRLGNLDKERVDRLNEVNDQLIQAQQDYADESNKKTEDDNKKKEDAEKKHQKEMADLRKKGVDYALKLLESQSKAREEQYRKEADASKDLENQLIAQVNAGVDSAEDSLAVQKQVTAEKMRLAEMEQKRQEALKQIQVGYQILEQLIAKGDSAPVAAVKTVGLLDFIKGIFLKAKGFFVGTDDTGTVASPWDANGGRPAILHDNEQVWSKKDRQQVGFKSRKELIAASQFYDSFRVNNMLMLDGMQRDPKREEGNFSPVMIEQLRKLDVIASKLDEFPRELFDTEVRNGVLYAFHLYQKGNDREKTHLNV